MSSERSTGVLAIIGIIILYLFWAYLIIETQSVKFTIMSGIIFVLGIFIIKLRYFPKNFFYYLNNEK
jgi:hypothetical protein